MNNTENSEKTPRKRSLTEITLGWLAERIRKAEKIKAEIASGTYKVESAKIASAIVNDEKS